MRGTSSPAFSRRLREWRSTLGRHSRKTISFCGSWPSARRRPFSFSSTPTPSSSIQRLTSPLRSESLGTSIAKRISQHDVFAQTVAARRANWHPYPCATEATTEGTQVYASSQRSEWNHRRPVRLLQGQMAVGCRRSERTSEHERESSSGRARQGRQVQACITRSKAPGEGNRGAVGGELGAAFQPDSSR